MARGELHCVGATTLDEYRKYIEKDAALERRFQKVLVDEPSVEDTIAILRGLKERYEVHHGVEITDPAIVAAATLSHRYISDRQLPDKAIDLIDEAGSLIRMEIDSKPEALDKLDRRIIQLKIEREALKKEADEASRKRLVTLEDSLKGLEKEYSDLEEVWKAEKASVQGAAHIKEELERARTDLDTARRAQDLGRMSELQYGRIPELEQRLAKALEAEKKPNQLLRNSVTEVEIAEIVSKWTGIPVSRMLEGERDKLLRMEEVLEKRVVGQHEAVKAVADAIRRSRAGLSDPHRPLGSFLFLGPTGVGKTELCKALAEFMFDTEEAMIRIDMSEFMEKHSVARLIGAPPGYVGYEEGGYLTEAVRRRPYSVILLDEIEKAHPDVFNVLLQVLDDGRLTDGQGRTVDFRNCVIIMTSNLGSQVIQELAGEANYAKMKEAVMQVVTQHFRPEFINRVDELVVFHPLGREQIRSIVDIQLGRLRQRLAERDIQLRLDDAARDRIGEAGFDTVYGARPLKRAIQSQIENPLAQQILRGDFIAGDRVVAKLKRDALDIREGALALSEPTLSCAPGQRLPRCFAILSRATSTRSRDEGNTCLFTSISAITAGIRSRPCRRSAMRRLKKCPHCGKAQLKKLMSAPVFRLKGGGWYETDFKSDGDNKRNLADRPDDAPKEDKKETTAEAGSKDATPADTTKTADKPAEKTAAAEPAKKPAAERRFEPFCFHRQQVQSAQGRETAGQEAGEANRRETCPATLTKGSGRGELRRPAARACPHSSQALASRAFPS